MISDQLVERLSIRRGRNGAMLLALAAATILSGACRPGSASSSDRASDSTCTACQDFYRYANKTWLDTATIPATSSTWGVWNANDARVTAQMHDILVAAAAGTSTGAPGERTLGMLYASCMDSVRAEQDGVAPLRPVLARIEAITTPTELIRELGRLHRDGITAAFVFTSDVDRQGGGHYTAFAQQSRLALSRDDYLNTDSTATQHRGAYRDHIVRTFSLAGEAADAARRDADHALALETAFAKASMTRMQRVQQTLQDMFRVYSRADLDARTPGFSWKTYLAEREAPPVHAVISPQPDYFTAIAHLVTQRPIAEWRAYLRWQVLSDASPFLSSAFVNEDFQYEQRGSGVAESAPRWERCVREVSSDVPELLGRAYAAHNFPASSKARINAMVKQIRAVLIDSIKTVPWLTEETRKETLKKAETFGVKIAYPDKWHDYSSLHITPGAFITQRAEARRFESDRMMKRIGGVPDPAEWDFHGIYHYVPQSPTAWANWTEIIFPAAYLQPPLYDSTADAATNYGAIGIIIGHEMTHLFTADGGDVDAQGRIHHWWTSEDSTRFAALQNRLIEQYNNYTVVDSATHVNGALTLSENLADLGGVELSYAALKRSLADQPRATQGDTTPEMRFFLSYAHIRASKSRPDYLRRQLSSDGHAPSMARVDGPFSNFPPFATTFGCKPGDPMVRPDSLRVEIW